MSDSTPEPENASGRDEARWRSRLEEALGPLQMSLVDESWRHAGHLPAGSPRHGTHLSLRIVSGHFEGKSLPERHRLVYAALGFGSDPSSLHALRLRTLTPQEAARRTDDRD